MKEFALQLPVMYLDCPVAGQVLQRCHAHKYLEPNIRLVFHLDDDITLDPDSLDNALGKVMLNDIHHPFPSLLHLIHPCELCLL